ncbi:hypothetical protein [uncultured Christiangramia sp.]|uniref:hypothetical protein n=1 Tax=uncultured Christiangramia sp. TaxID=503836 RepID=UPI002637E008|nr:hypothetical protein [uncultured Christiangramia sp.]
MKKIEHYRPAFIEFTTESNEVPKFLGEKKFESSDEAHKFINEHFVASSTKFQAERKMDQYEIDKIREEYQEELEEILPQYKGELKEAERILAEAKASKNAAQEAVNACLNKIQTLSIEAQEGVTEMNLDQAFTYEFVYNGKRFYYTIMDKKIQLCGVRDIPMYEADDLISSSERNAKSFEQMKEVVNG